MARRILRKRIVGGRAFCEQLESRTLMSTVHEAQSYWDPTRLWSPGYYSYAGSGSWSGVDWSTTGWTGDNTSFAVSLSSLPTHSSIQLSFSFGPSGDPADWGTITAYFNGQTYTQIGNSITFGVQHSSSSAFVSFSGANWENGAEWQPINARVWTDGDTSYPPPVSTPVVSISSSNGAEGGSSILYTVSRDVATNPLTVNLSSAFETASYSDFTPQTSFPAQISFAQNEYSKQFYLPVEDDDVPEAKESLTYSIQPGTGYTIQTGSAQAWILDNEQNLAQAAGPETPCMLSPRAEAPGSGSPQPSYVSEAPINYFNGGLQYNTTDLTSSGFGNLFGVTRSFSNLSEQYVRNEFGSGFVSSFRPTLRELSDGSIQVILDGQRSLWFDHVGAGWVGRFGISDRLVYRSPTLDYQLTDTTGQVITFYAFDSSIAAEKRGQVASLTDAQGNLTTFTYDANGLLSSVSRTEGSVTETFSYTRVGGTGANKDLVASVELRRNSVLVSRAAYEYYVDADSYGSNGDLKLVTVTDAAGEVMQKKYYRYYESASSIGYQHGLRYVFETDAFARLAAAYPNYASATDLQVDSYATFYFEYDTSNRVTKERAQGAGCSAAGGSGEYTFAYFQGTSEDENEWHRKTVETLPDGSQNIVYMNFFGQVILKEYRSGSESWVNYYQYDAAGRLVTHAHPSAVVSYSDATADLSVVLRSAEGLVERISYYTSTTATASSLGGVAGYEWQRTQQKGSGSTSVVVSSQRYLKREAGGITIYPLGETVTNGYTLTTLYTYTWADNSTRMLSMIVTREAVPTAQHGSGSTTTEQVWFDSSGRAVWSRDAGGYLVYKRYDAATGAVLQRIDDANPALVTDSPITNPTRSGSLPTALHLVTNREVDALRRITMRQDANGSVTYKVYKNGGNEQRVYRGWTGSATTGPIEITIKHLPTGGTDLSIYHQTLTISATPTVSGGRPTGQELITSSAIRSLARTWTNGGGQTTSQQSYFSFAGLTWSDSGQVLGTASNTTASGNYHETTYGYEKRGRVAWTKAASGTITHIFYTPLGQAEVVWVGLDDVPASDATGDGATDWRDFRYLVLTSGSLAGTDLVKTAEYSYDVSSGNLMKSLAIQGENAGVAYGLATEYLYDWRNQVIGTKYGASADPLTEDVNTNRQILQYVYDDAGRITKATLYDGDAKALVDADQNGLIDGLTTSLRRSESTYAYDPLGQLYKSEDFLINQSTGSSSGSVVHKNWYDARGNLVKTRDATGLVAKYVYDGAGRLKMMYQTDGGSDTDALSHALDVVGDQVLTQAEFAYDGAGNLLTTTVRERFHNATGTGELGSPTSGIGARVSYSANWYDQANRLTASAEVGTNGGAPYTRESSVPGRSDTRLVTSFVYSDAGKLFETTDPRGNKNRQYSDMLGRMTRMVEAYVDEIANSYDDRITDYTYDGQGRVLQMTASNRVPGAPSTTSQTTQYVYSVRNANGLNTNELLSSITYPGAGAESYQYDRAGQLTTMTDRNGSVHQYGYDAMGRLASDTISTKASAVDGSVLRLGYTYNALGLGEFFTSYSNTAGTVVVEQVKREYNGFGQLLTEYQQTDGAVNTGTSPRVGYEYTLAKGNRLAKMTYPNGRVLRYEYSGGIDDTIGRVSYLADELGGGYIGTHLEEYSYLGLSTIVERKRPENNVNLSYVKLAGESNGDAGDQYTGLDRFGRVADQRWGLSGTDVDRYKYGYDRNGNRLYKENLGPNAGPRSEAYQYDKFNRLSRFDQGTLGANKLIASPVRYQTYGLDALGNWTSFNDTGTATTRTHNTENEITSQGMTYDANGNATRDETGRTFTYDAWNRIMTVKDTGGATVFTFKYDALNRRVDQNDQQFYYSKDWQVLQDDRDMVKRQYVWSLAYVDALVLRDRDTDGNAGTGHIAMYGSGFDERLYVLQDANWNTTALVTTAGVVVERYMYSPYGVVNIRNGNWSLNSNPGGSYDWVYLHQGGRWNAAAGTYHFRHRDYSPTLGRWMNQDPLGYVDGGNLYEYVRGGPTGSVDPMGLNTFSPGGGWYFSGAQSGGHFFVAGYSSTLITYTSDQRRLIGYNVYDCGTGCEIRKKVWQVPTAKGRSQSLRAGPGLGGGYKWVVGKIEGVNSSDDLAGPGWGGVSGELTIIAIGGGFQKSPSSHELGGGISFGLGADVSISVIDYVSIYADYMDTVEEPLDRVDRAMMEGRSCTKRFERVAPVWEPNPTPPVPTASGL